MKERVSASEWLWNTYLQDKKKGVIKLYMFITKKNFSLVFQERMLFLDQIKGEERR